MFARAASFALAQLAYALYASGDLAAARTTIMEVFYLTLTVLYVAAHLVFDSRNALRISLAIYASGIVLVLVRIPSEIYGSLSIDEGSWLLRIHAFMGRNQHSLRPVLHQRSVKVEGKTMHRLAHTH